MNKDSFSLTIKRLGCAIVLAYIALVVSIGAPAILQLREAARFARCKNQLGQMALAVESYHEVHKSLPPGGTFDQNDIAHHAWMTFLCPYLSGDAWYTFVDYHVPWDDPKNVGVFMKKHYMIHLQDESIAEKETKDGFPVWHYAANQNLMYRNSATTLADYAGKLNTTFLLAEANGEFSPSGYPYNWRDPAKGLGTSVDGFGSPVRNITLLAMLDGSVREISHSIDAVVHQQLSGATQESSNRAMFAKPDGPYRLKSDDYWRFDWCSRGNGTSGKFLLSRDGTILRCLIHSYPRDSVSTGDTEKTIETLIGKSRVEHIEIEGSIYSQEIEFFAKLPYLKRLTLSKARVFGDREAALKAVPAHVVID